MNWLDFIILLLLAGSFISGFRMGLIYKVGTVAGFILGLWVGSRVAASLLEGGAGSIFSVVGIFFFVLTLVRVVCGWIAYVIQKIFNIVAIIPGLKFANRVFGALLSVLLTILTIGVVLYMMRALSLNSGGGVLTDMIDASLLGNIFVNIVEFLPLVISNRLRALLENPMLGT